jgi:segregation and condensation protein A
MNDFAPAPAMAPDRDPGEPEALVLDLDGYEGPIDLLLSLARAQKLDLARISILALADQYLDFIAAQRRLDLEVAADYLVMAAILAYLKSCLLLPPAPRDDDEPNPQELALVLRHRLGLLEAMQRAGRRLMARPLLGREVFGRGAPEEPAVVMVPSWQDGLYELLRGYAEVHRRQSARVLAIEPSAFQSVQEALERLARLLGRAMNWRELSSFLLPASNGEESRRSSLAASFAAALELVRLGRVELRQDRAFGPIWLRRAAPGRATRQ